MATKPAAVGEVGYLMPVISVAQRFAPSRNAGILQVFLRRMSDTIGQRWMYRCTLASDLEPAFMQLKQVIHW